MYNRAGFLCCSACIGSSLNALNDIFRMISA
jgi:hypothetical protein